MGETYIVNGQVYIGRRFQAKTLRLVQGKLRVLDVDALTGGFNLQIAWSTAVSCARNFI